MIAAPKELLQNNGGGRIDDCGRDRDDRTPGADTVSKEASAILEVLCTVGGQGRGASTSSDGSTHNDSDSSSGSGGAEGHHPTATGPRLGTRSRLGITWASSC